MEFRIIDKISNAGNGKWNEDATIILPDCIAVIDGATSIKNREFEGYETYAEWFVQEFKRLFLLNYKTKYHIPSFIKLCVDKIEKKYPLLDIPLYEKPTFTFSGAQIIGNSLMCFAIGDCSIYIQEKNGTINSIYDKRVDQFSNKTLLKLQYAKKNDLDLESYIRETRISNVNYRNKPNGFWVVGYDGNFEKEFVQREYDIENLQSVLICSDGFNRGFKEFSLLSTRIFFRDQPDLKLILQDIRNYEELNYERYDFPCVKKSDDATAVFCSFKT